MNTTTIGVFLHQNEAENAVADLRDNNVPYENISYIYENRDGAVATKPHTDDTVGSETAEGIATGTAIGAIAGLAVAAGILPGLGALFVAGPLAAALGLTGVAATTVAGAATGAVAGGLVGALVGLGISAEDATLYEQEVKSGNIVLVVASQEPVPTPISAILAQHQAIEIREYTRE